MYTSGQLAKHCHISVRTVQYYDQQGLLHARRTASNQRRYQEDDLRRLQRILAYRQLGFTIKDIRELLDQQDDQALRTAIALQEQHIRQELQAAQDRLTGLAYLRDQLTHTGNFPGNITAHVRANHARRLIRLRVRTVVVGLLVDLLIWGNLAYVIWRGANIGWLVAGILVSLILIGEVVVSYYQHAQYVCPHCQKHFIPNAREWFWSKHTPNTRQLTCPFCQQKNYCIEEYRPRADS